MSDGIISVREFERFERETSAKLKTLNDDSRDIKEAVFEIAKSIEKDVALTKQMFREHTIEYNHDKESYNRRFTNLAQRVDELVDAVDSREPLFQAANNIKWVLLIALTGFLTMFGKDIYTTLSERKTEVKPPIDISRDKNQR